MEFGMPTLIENKDLIESAKLCRSLGLSFVELNMNLPQYQLDQIENIKCFQNVAKQYGIYYTIHLDENLNVCDFNQLVTKCYLETVERTIAVAKQLQVSVINMHMHPGVYFTLPTKKVYLYQQYKEKYLKDIKIFRTKCEDWIKDDKIYISIENTDGFMEYQKEAIDLLLESEKFSLTWDRCG